MAGAVPYRLLDEASWATQGCASLLPTPLGDRLLGPQGADSRHPSEHLSAPLPSEATYVQRCDDQPAADPASVLLRLPG